MKEQAVGCEIEARGITYKIPTKKKTYPFKIFSQEEKINQETRTRDVLNNINFKAKPWEILAIVGPSGAGKSTLLEILSGNLSPKNGSILVNQIPVNKLHFNKISGYVTQRDTLFPLLTVEETLLFSAKLRLRLPKPQLRSKVESLLQELGLDHVARTRVGDNSNIRGISGGERRRVSIGVGVMHDPKVLILDEPTSSLDSTSALQIIDMLKVMAEMRGRTIILSIHQPGFRIVKLFNSILLMASGSVVQQGTVDQLALSLQEMGLQLPLHVNTVEFAIDSMETIQQHQKPVSLQPKQQKAEETDNGGHTTTTTTLKQLFQQSRFVLDEDYIYSETDSTPTFVNSRLQETAILTHRFFKNVSRTKELFAYRTIQMLVSGLVLGSIFYNINHDLEGAEERVGLFAFILTFLLSCTTEALPIFLQEREILMKETSCGSYRVSSYAIANSLVYLPFLLIQAFLFTVPLYWLVGLNPNFLAFLHFLLLIWMILYTANSVVVCFSALVPNFIVGSSMISGVMGSYFLFSGYFISKHGIPNYWIFMHYMSLFKYPFEGFLINEFSGSGKCLEYRMGTCMVSAEDVLREEGYGEESRWRNVVIMLCFILVYRFLAYVILKIRCSSSTLKSALL